MIGRYQTPKAFRTALEERLKQLARQRGADLMRLRRQVAFDRLLARLFAEPDPPWLLKGGYAFELRLGGSARSTRDIDLSIPALDRLIGAGEAPQDPSAVIREHLQDAAERDLNDGFVFRIGEAVADLEAAPYGGTRYPIEARLDSRTFATFHLDVGIGDVIMGQPEWLTGQDLLGFAGITPLRVAALTREQQFAEKVHAYTLPRGARANTRVKDLVDLVLPIELGLREPEQVRRALRATFDRRGSHPLPVQLNSPPEAWAAPYADLAMECGLDLTTLGTGFTFVTDYWVTLWTHAAP